LTTASLADGPIDFALAALNQLRPGLTECHQFIRGFWLPPRGIYSLLELILGLQLAGILVLPLLFYSDAYCKSEPQIFQAAIPV
jgi:hypothetical protein